MAVDIADVPSEGKLTFVENHWSQGRLENHRLYKSPIGGFALDLECGLCAPESLVFIKDALLRALS